LRIHKRTQIRSDLEKEKSKTGRRGCRHDKKQKRKVMKLSIESKVAIAVATGFIALTIGAMAQGRSGGGTGGPNGYGPMNNPGLSHMSPQGLRSSEVGRTTAEDARTKFDSSSSTTTEETTTTTKKGK